MKTMNTKVKNVTKRVTKVFQIQHVSFIYNRPFYRNFRKRQLRETSHRDKFYSRPE